MRLDYEFVGADPFYHGEAIANAQALRRKQMAKIGKSPVYLIPIMNLLWGFIYRVYWTPFMGLVWLGYAVGDYLRPLADI